MREHPILFSTAMVQAILEGRKTQTRRIVPEKILGAYSDYDDWCNSVMPRDIPCTRTYEKQYYLERVKWKPGDILWVRETWSTMDDLPYDNYVYRTDYGTTEDDSFPPSMFKWRPSIYMPREACRLRLLVKNVRIERLQEISEADAVAEGCRPGDQHGGDNSSRACTAKQSFMWLWMRLNAKRGYGWEQNPWVYVVEFERIAHA